MSGQKGPSKGKGSAKGAAGAWLSMPMDDNFGKGGKGGLGKGALGKGSSWPPSHPGMMSMIPTIPMIPPGAFTMTTGMGMGMGVPMEMQSMVQSAVPSGVQVYMVAVPQQMPASYQSMPASSHSTPANDDSTFDGRDTSCVICMNDFQDGERVARLGCRHLLHRSCYDVLLGTVDSGRTPPCPTCRGTQAVVATYEFKGVDNFDFAEQQVMEANTLLDSMGKEIQEKDQEIDQKTREMDSMGKEIQEKDKEIQEKDKEIDSMGKEIQEKDKEIDQKTREMDRKCKEVHNLKEEVHNLKEEVHNSRARNRSQACGRPTCYCSCTCLWDDSVRAQLQNRSQAFEGLLVRSTAVARVEDDSEDWNEDDLEIDIAFKYDDEDHTCARSQRRSLHGAPRGMRTHNAWVTLPNLQECEVPSSRPRKEKLKVRVPAHPRGQKKALVVGARLDVAKARRLRRPRQSAKQLRQDV